MEEEKPKAKKKPFYLVSVDRTHKREIDEFLRRRKRETGARRAFIIADVLMEAVRKQQKEDESWEA